MAPMGSTLGVQVGLQEPQVLVDFTGDSREQIRGIRISGPGGFIDARANLGAEAGYRVGQRLDVLNPLGDVLGIGRQRAAAGYRCNRSVGDPAQSRDPLRKRIDVILDVLGYLVKKLMQSDEVRALHVPVGLLRPQHRLRMTGTHEAIEEAMATLRGDAAPSWVIDRIRRRSDETGTDIAVGEMIVTADSRLIGRTLPSSGIADLYGVAVIGTHRPDRLVGEKEQFSEGGDLRFAEGDVLLVMGLADDMQHFARSDSLLQLEGMRELPRRSKAVLAAGIMGGSITLASIGLVPIAIASLAGAILMFVTGCVKFDRVGRGLSGSVIVLVAASIALGRIILESGAADWIGGVMAAGLDYLSPGAALAAIMLAMTFLTNFASNATAATVGTPIAFAIASKLDLPPEPLVLAVLFGCNLCYATPIAYQTNMLIMAEGSYEFRDYVRTGVPLVLIMVTVLSLALVVTYGL